MKHVLMGLLKVYRLVISPLYGDVCRYYPSCSAYALRALDYHGAVKGSWYATLRVLRCHPWAAGGYDPVRGTPEHDEEIRAQSSTEVTMESEPDGAQSEVPAEHRATCGGPTGRGAKRNVTVGRIGTVGLGRGVK